MMTEHSRYRVLILGACGFVGRNFVLWLVQNNLCSLIRVADKSPPTLSFFHSNHEEAFNHETVHFVHADLSRSEHVEKVFTLDDGQFDFVFNLCGETRFALPESSYERNIVKTAELCGQKALQHCVKRFVELSTAHVYKANKQCADESSALEPWTIQARYRLRAEELLMALTDLPLVVLRAAYIYGDSDRTSITPRLCVAAVYQYLNEKMKLLWSTDLKINCVNVIDVCVAMWTAATSLPVHATLNLADKTDLDQGQLNTMLSELFGIKTGFHGTIVSNIAKMNFQNVVKTANDKHVPAWQKLCQSLSVMNTPISPFLDESLLRHNHLSIDGSAICRVVDFHYSIPHVTVDILRQQVQQLITANHFPAVLSLSDADGGVKKRTT